MEREEKIIVDFCIFSDVSRVLENHEASSEAEWADLFGTHVLRPLSNMEYIMLSESDYTQIKECPCGCKFPIVMGDTSMGRYK